MAHTSGLATAAVIAAVLLLLESAAAAPGATAPLSLADCRISAGPGFPGMKARCGVLERPLDPSAADSPQLELHFAVVPALTLEPEPDPFVPIAGGPGQSTIEFYAAYANAFEHIRRDRDIVLLDQRGTGKSAPLTCAMDDGMLEGRLSRDQAIEDARRCLQALPHDPRFFTTSVAVSDLDALREALGYPAFNVYGVSYGTRVAQHFARRYEARTRTVILDGVLPPGLALGPEIAIEAQRALDAIFDRCAESAACDERFPAVAEEFAALQTGLREEPVTVELPDPVTWKRERVPFGDAELAGALRILSYHPNTVALMPLLIHEAAGGNYRPLASQFLMATRSMLDALSIGMHNAVVCTEDAPFFASEDVSLEELESTYMGTVQLDALEAICSVWPRGVLDEDLRTPLETDTPVLLLSGDADPVTPPRFAEMAAVKLSNSRHLIGIDQGHGQAPRTCIPEIMAEFIETAAFAGLDEDCLAERQFAMPFFLDFTGPSP
ncbi:MAG TPA: alpha/beta fold hydrolase [Woeseiaceae bacterium]|nr:alpha/beta fold hydrolase [Woeseiaceae bacterium]